MSSEIYMPKAGIMIRKPGQGGVAMACMKINFHGYEISIAVDDSCGAFKDQLARTDIRVYNDLGADVTTNFGIPNQSYTSDDLFVIMSNIVRSEAI